MIAAILSLLGSSAAGSLIGGLFAFLNRKADLQSKALDLAHEKDKWAHDLTLRQADLEQVKAEAAGRREVAIIEGDASVDAARMGAIAAAQIADKVGAAELAAAGGWRWALVLTDAYRRLIRPLATTVLLVCALYIDLKIITHFQGSGWDALPAEDKKNMALAALAFITAQASGTTQYWFMTRNNRN